MGPDIERHDSDLTRSFEMVTINPDRYPPMTLPEALAEAYGNPGKIVAIPETQRTAIRFSGTSWQAWRLVGLYERPGWAYCAVGPGIQHSSVPDGIHPEDIIRFDSPLPSPVLVKWHAIPVGLIEGLR